MFLKKGVQYRSRELPPCGRFTAVTAWLIDRPCTEVVRRVVGELFFVLLFKVFRLISEKERILMDGWKWKKLPFLLHCVAMIGRRDEGEGYQFF